MDFSLPEPRDSALKDYSLDAVRMQQLILAVNRLAMLFDHQEPEYFPWRITKDPFHILLAEMMLVRTRADLVVGAFTQLIQRYGTAAELARARDEDISKILQPLGLSKRIPFFKRAAEYISINYPQGLPSNRRELEAIPGVGRYTADAVLAFAFDQPIMPADVNVFRWLSRVTGLPMTNKSKGSRDLRELLPLLAPIGGRKAYLFLDFARTICRPQIPNCSACFVQQYCIYGTAKVGESSP